MAPDRGESVSFTCAYAGNLRELAGLLRELDRRGRPSAELLEEVQELLDVSSGLYDSQEAKKAVLERYAQRCAHTVSGRTISVAAVELAGKLEGMADWLMEHIRKQEWIDAGDGMGWFNSYYDDHGRPVEGLTADGVRMMLTGQVFAVMSGTATEAQTAAIVQSADRYLFQEDLGGYRLNTDFKELKFDLGRMFGFAYGEKENGAVFSHMAVMYANALYRRGFVREGWRALRALADAALNFDRSRIYPGIPEYFNGEGRGAYHYLTGAASWYVLTLVTQSFGVRGERGDLVIAPRLLREQFDEAGRAGLGLVFAGKPLRITFVNPTDGDCGSVQKAWLAAGSPEARPIPVEDGRAVLPRAELERLPDAGGRITIELK